MINKIMKDSDIKLMDPDKLKKVLSALKDCGITDDLIKTLNNAGNDYIKFGMKARGELAMRENTDKGGWCFSFAKALEEIIKTNSAIEIDNGHVVQDISRFEIILKEMIKRKLSIAEWMVSVYQIVRMNIKNYWNILDSYNRSY